MVKIRVLLVDDDALVRAGLRMILSSSKELEVVGEAADGANAVAAVRAHRPDVVLMDIRMPGMDGIAATSALRRLATPPHVIVLTTFQADELVMSALRAGESSHVAGSHHSSAVTKSRPRDHGTYSWGNHSMAVAS